VFVSLKREKQTVVDKRSDLIVLRDALKGAINSNGTSFKKWAEAIKCREESCLGVLLSSDKGYRRIWKEKLFRGDLKGV